MSLGIMKLHRCNSRHTGVRSESNKGGACYDCAPFIFHSFMRQKKVKICKGGYYVQNR